MWLYLEPQIENISVSSGHHFLELSERCDFFPSKYSCHFLQDMKKIMDSLLLSFSDSFQIIFKIEGNNAMFFSMM